MSALWLQLDPLTHTGLLTNELLSPARIALMADGTVLVSDPFKNHIAQFDASGTQTWPVPEGPLGVAAHPDGRYFVSLRTTAQVAIYDSAFTFLGYLGDGDPLVTFDGPIDIAIAANTGRIYVVDAEGHDFYGFESDGTLTLKVGTRGHLPGQFIYPSAIALYEDAAESANDRIFVADHGNFRVQVFFTRGVRERESEARMELEKLGVDLRKAKEGLYVADAPEACSKLIASACDAGVKVLNMTSVDDVVLKNGRVCGVVVNWTSVGALPRQITCVDPVSLEAGVVVDATGRDAAMVEKLVRRGLVELAGMGPMDAGGSEDAIVENTGEWSTPALSCAA